MQFLFVPLFLLEPNICAVGLERSWMETELSRPFEQGISPRMRKNDIDHDAGITFYAANIIEYRSRARLLNVPVERLHPDGIIPDRMVAPTFTRIEIAMCPHSR